MVQIIMQKICLQPNEEIHYDGLNNDVITEPSLNLMFCVTCNPAETLNSILIFVSKKEKLCEESQTK